MRRLVAITLAVATVLTTASLTAASGAAPAKRYLRLSAVARFEFSLDYGGHRDAVFNGRYSKLIGYRVRAIVVFNGRTVSAPPGSMIVSGLVFVRDEMKQWRSDGLHTQRVCANTRFQNPETTTEWSTTTAGPFQFAKSGGINISGGRAVIDPGNTIVWNIGCSATEQLENHGLPGGPSAAVPAPAKARFSGTRPFEIACEDFYRHDFAPGDVNGHSFDGHVDIAMRFTPFPTSKLPQAKKQLRDLAAGKGNAGLLEGVRRRDCL